MIIDYIVVLLFLIILIRIIKRLGIYKSIIASLMLGLIYWSMRMAGKEINTVYFAGIIIIASLAVFSYETFKSLAHYGCHKKCLAAWMLFVIQLATSPFIVLYIASLISSDISCLSLISNTFICTSAVIYRGVNVISIPKDNIMVFVNLTAFLLIQQIRKMHWSKN